MLMTTTTGFTSARAGVSRIRDRRVGHRDGAKRTEAAADHRRCRLRRQGQRHGRGEELLLDGARPRRGVHDQEPGRRNGSDHLQDQREAVRLRRAGLEGSATESRLLFVSFETDDAKALRTYLASKGVEVPKAVAPGSRGQPVADGEGSRKATTCSSSSTASRSLHGKNKGKFLSPRRSVGPRAARRLSHHGSGQARSRSTRTSSATG